jgi:hypothetical protein
MLSASEISRQLPAMAGHSWLRQLAEGRQLSAIEAIASWLRRLQVAPPALIISCIDAITPLFS